jgi:hypothetical protein
MLRRRFNRADFVIGLLRRLFGLCLRVRIGAEFLNCLSEADRIRSRHLVFQGLEATRNIKVLRHMHGGNALPESLNPEQALLRSPPGTVIPSAVSYFQKRYNEMFAAAEVPNGALASVPRHGSR